MIRVCAYCEHTDGMIYTSIPPKIRCTLTGEWHDRGDVCDNYEEVKVDD